MKNITPPKSESSWAGDAFSSVHSATENRMTLIVSGSQSLIPSKYGKRPEMGIKRILRIQEVKHVTGLSRTSIYRQMAAEQFPAAVRLGPQAVGWFEHEIQAWIESLERTRDFRGES
jgi:prophage regulatory protein